MYRIETEDGEVVGYVPVVPTAAADSAEGCSGDDWQPLTVSESVKFWATILGVPAAVLLLGFAAAVWP